MKRQAYVFCHGFGLSPKFWEALLPYFKHAPCFCINLGYFDSEPTCHIELNTKDYDFIGITHSIGLAKLLTKHIKFTAIIGLNAFTSFLGNNDLVYNKRLREYEIFKKNLYKNPRLTLEKFYVKCGLSKDFENLNLLNLTRLLKDIDMLKKPIFINTSCPILIINSINDQVFPPKLTNDNFSKTPVILDILNDGLHGLGFLLPNIIQQKIYDFIA
jgi:pimeloyl-[acyl-carrier protein] methyl ester esterase